MDFDAQKTSDAIGEGQRFVQLMHGVEWMTQLASAALAAKAVVSEREAALADLDKRSEAVKADFKATYGKLTVDLNAQVDTLEGKLEALEEQIKAKGEEHVAMLATADKAKAAIAAELNDMKAGAGSVLSALKAEVDAKAKERDALQAAIDDMHAKVAGLRG